MKNLLLPLVFTTASAAMAGTVTTDGPDLVLNTKGGLSIKTADDQYGFGIGGRLQWDYDNTETNSERTTNDMEVRRARVVFTGFAGDWSFKTQINVGEDDGGSTEDLFIKYSGWSNIGSITIGKQKEPFGLEELGSSNDMPVLERTGFSEFFAPKRTAGIQLDGAKGKFLYNIGVFDEDRSSSSDEDVSKVAVTGRLAFAPVNEKGKIVHLATAYRAAGETNLYGLEAGAVLGAWHAQAEYASLDTDGAPDLDGYYVQFGYVLTGESRPYKDGRFKKIKGSGDIGAIELVARYENGYGKYSDVGLATAEGEQTAIGINWYVNSNVRLGASYMDGETDDGQDGQELRIRAQFTF